MWCLTPLSTIFQLYRGGQWWRKPTFRMSLINCIICCIEYTSSWAGFELTTLVVIDTGCTCCFKSNYHAITTTTVPVICHDIERKSTHTSCQPPPPFFLYNNVYYPKTEVAYRYSREIVPIFNKTLAVLLLINEVR